MTDQPDDPLLKIFQNGQTGRRESEETPRVFFYFTDPETAHTIADRGFADSGYWSPQSTLTLLDKIPAEMQGDVLRVILTPENTREALRREASDHGEGFRRFMVPMELLRDAEVTMVRHAE